MSSRFAYAVAAATLMMLAPAGLALGQTAEAPAAAAAPPALQPCPEGEGTGGATGQQAAREAGQVAKSTAGAVECAPSGPCGEATGGAAPGDQQAALLEQRQVAMPQGAGAPMGPSPAARRPAGRSGNTGAGRGGLCAPLGHG